MTFLHPDVAVALGHPGLGVEEREADAPLGTQPGVIVVALLHGIPVVLFPKAAG